MKKIDLTILLTLYDRDKDTSYWLNENIYPLLNYYIADGSLRNNNQKIFLKRKFENLEYKRFNYDSNTKDYLNKLKKSLNSIKTKYVMINDNDDFIVTEGLKKIVTFLNKNKEYNFCSGKIYYIKKTKRNVNKFFFYLSSLNNYGYSKDNYIKSLKNYLLGSNGCSYLWYSVYRKEFLLRIINKLIKNKIYDWEAIEIFHTIYSLKYGKYKYLNNCHYIRQISNDSVTMNLETSESFMESFVKDIDKQNKIIESIIEKEKINQFEMKKIFRKNTMRRINARNRQNLFKKIHIYFLSRILSLFKLKLSSIRFILS